MMPDGGHHPKTWAAASTASFRNCAPHSATMAGRCTSPATAGAGTEALTFSRRPAWTTPGPALVHRETWDLTRTPTAGIYTTAWMKAAEPRYNRMPSHVTGTSASG